MKILLFNQGHTNNIGDVAINSVITKFLEDKGYNIDFCPYNIDIFFDNYFGILLNKFTNRILSLFDICNFIRIFKVLRKNKYNAIVVGGGELLGNHKGFNSNFYIITLLAKFFSVPVFVFGVGGTTKLNKRLFRRYKSALKKCKYISVRTEKFRDEIKTDYLIECEYSPDVVFSYKNIFENNIKNIDIGKNVLLIPIKYYDIMKETLNVFSENELIDYYKKKIIEINLNDYNTVLLSYTELEDKNICYTLYNEFKDKINIKIIDINDLNDYIKLLSDCSLVISARMHGLILAMNYSCKIDVIKYNYKLIDFFNMIKNCNEFSYYEGKSLEGLNKLLNSIIGDDKSE